MRTLRLKIYKFEELSNDAKQVAIEWYKNQNNDFGTWAVDDCSLFEPTQTELDAIGYDSNKGFLIENTRESIYFDTDRNSFLDCAKAMNVTDKDLFLKWLGITDKLAEKTDFKIYTQNGVNADTTIEFEEGYSCEFTDEDWNILIIAKNKFDDHIQDVLNRIRTDIDYRYTDECISDDLIVNDYEFTINGNRF